MTQSLSLLCTGLLVIVTAALAEHNPVDGLKLQRTRMANGDHMDMIDVEEELDDPDWFLRGIEQPLGTSGSSSDPVPVHVPVLSSQLKQHLAKPAYRRKVVSWDYDGCASILGPFGKARFEHGWD